MLPAVSFGPQLQRSLTSDVVPLVLGTHLDFIRRQAVALQYWPVSEVALGAIRMIGKKTGKGTMTDDAIIDLYCHISPSAFSTR